MKKLVINIDKTVAALTAFSKGKGWEGIFPENTSPLLSSLVCLMPVWLPIWFFIVPVFIGCVRDASGNIPSQPLPDK